MQRQSVSQETIQPDRLSRLSIKSIDFASQTMRSQIDNLLMWQHKVYTLTSVAQCAVSHWKLHRRNRNAGTGTARWSFDARIMACATRHKQRHESDVSHMPRMLTQ